jgi:Gpi18-like mannosyltransferase
VRDANGARLRITLIGGFLLAASVRVIWLCAFEDSWDMGRYRELVEAAPRGGDLYGRAQNHYSPIWPFMLLGISRAASALCVPFPQAVGAVLFLADVATAFLLFRIARDRLARPAASAAGAALLFFSNPVSVFASGFHLQWDTLAILCLVAAIWSADQARPAVTSASLTLSLLVKHATFFHPLLFAFRGKGKAVSLLFLVPYAVFLASLLPYWTVRDAVFRGVLGYRSLAEEYGSAMLLKLPSVPEWAPTVLFGLAALIAVVALRRVEIGRACLMLFLVLLIFVPGIVQYYFVWPIALGSLYGGAGFFVYTVVVSAFFLGSPDGLAVAFEHFPGWHGVWWATLFWLMWELRRIQGSKVRLQSRDVP